MKKLLVSLMLLFLLPGSTSAARIFFEQDTERSNYIHVLIDTEGERVNAYAAMITAADDIVQDILTGESVVTFWLEMPRAGREISFSGLTPLGFEGVGTLFSLVLKPTSTSSVLTAHDALVLRNDGLGTPTPVRVFSIYPKPSNAAAPIEDTVQPEPFEAVMSSSPDLFDGAPFISFVAQDKQSGIVRYEWGSTFLFAPTAWYETHSPLVLSGPELYKRIFIKAIDHKGNERVITTAGPYWDLTALLLFIIGACVLFGVYASLRRFLFR